MLKRLGGHHQRQKMINLMYIVFIALMGLGIHNKNKEIETKADESFLVREELKSNIFSVKMGGEARSVKLTPFIYSSNRKPYRGEYYEADFILGVDSPLNTRIIIEGDTLDQKRYTYKANRLGVHTYSGHIEQYNSDSIWARYPFEGSFEVYEPKIYISSPLTSILYAGIDNTIYLSLGSESDYSISSMQAINSDALIEQKGEMWSIKPTLKDSTLSVKIVASSPQTNTLLQFEHKFKVRSLPQPTPYINLGGGVHFRGGGVLKSDLLQAQSIGAGIDDGLLEIDFEVISFQLVSFDGLGNVIPENSEGSLFSIRQKRKIKSAERGKRLYITDIKVRGADGLDRLLAPIELVVQ